MLACHAKIGIPGCNDPDCFQLRSYCYRRRQELCLCAGQIHWFLELAEDDFNFEIQNAKTKDIYRLFQLAFTGLSLMKINYH